MKDSEVLEIIKKVLDVFSEEYREETRYRECMKQNMDKMKFKLATEEDVDKKIKRLESRNYESNFKINIGDYE